MTSSGMKLNVSHKSVRKIVPTCIPFFTILGVTSIDHINFVTKATRPIQANWHPRRDDVFVVGCMENPRRVET